MTPRSPVPRQDGHRSFHQEVSCEPALSTRQHQDPALSVRKATQLCASSLICRERMQPSVLLRHPRYSRHWEASQCLLVHLWGWKAALEGTHKASAIPGLNSGPQSPAAVPVTSIPCYQHSLAVLSAGEAAHSSIKNKHPLNRTVPHYSSCRACPFPEAFAMRYELEVSPGPQMPVLVLFGKARGRTRSSGFQAEVL